jgi:hypothetical protein
MTKALKRYIFLYKKLQSDKIDDDIRDDYESEIDEIYYDLDDEDIDYIVENELEI